MLIYVCISGTKTSCIVQGMAVGSIVGGHTLLPLYGSWTFTSFSGAAFTSFIMTLVPAFYRRLDVNCEEVRLLHRKEPPHG